VACTGATGRDGGVEVGAGSFLSQNASVEPKPGVAGAPRIGRNVYVGVGARFSAP
jgi:serine O-acetyltransferase